MRSSRTLGRGCWRRIGRWLPRTSNSRIRRIAPPRSRSRRSDCGGCGTNAFGRTSRRSDRSVTSGMSMRPARRNAKRSFRWTRSSACPREIPRMCWRSGWVLIARGSRTRRPGSRSNGSSDSRRRFTDWKGWSNNWPSSPKRSSTSRSPWTRRARRRLWWPPATAKGCPSVGHLRKRPPSGSV
jgi:hypothetical protein